MSAEPQRVDLTAVMVRAGFVASVSSLEGAAEVEKQLETAASAIAELIAAVKQRRRALTRGQQRDALARETAALARFEGGP